MCCIVLVGLSFAQITPAESVVSTPAPQPSASGEAAQPAVADTEIALDPASLLPDLPSVTAGKSTLVGGTIERLDRVQDRLTVRVFGGDSMKILFDTRTGIYRDGVKVSASDLRQGDRVYVDTILDGNAIFARNIRLKGSPSVGESQGVIVSFYPEKGDLLIRDAISPHPFKVHVTSSTRLTKDGRAVSSTALTPGTLVAVKFGASQKGTGTASEISLLASNGASFTFGGQVTFLDLHSGLLVLMSSTDHKTYEIYLDGSQVGVNESLQRGADVTVLARFDGSHYVARRVEVNVPNKQ
jgi:hypothetical protein